MKESVSLVWANVEAGFGKRARPYLDELVVVKRNVQRRDSAARLPGVSALDVLG